MSADAGAGWVEVVRGGAATTVQDLGRPGFRAHGVPEGGAADRWAARAANRLVGNPDGAALLEIVLLGPALRFAEATRVAVVGDEFEVVAEGKPVPIGATVRLPAGGELRIGGARRGVRAWLAIAGGFDVPPRLDSRATELAAGFGGLEGRALRAGDRLALGPSPYDGPSLRLAADVARELAVPSLRVLAGPDAGRGGAPGVESLAGGAFRVGARSDRRGVRLEERPLASSGGGERRTQGVLPGTVQLPPSGDPIALGVDAPVTGGYPWIAQVIAADLGRLARLAPGARVELVPVDRAIAERALAERERALAEGIVAA